jgi:7,8-dihydropterin-6-yl-methyl-4-(beta-D-ribofuranosyl)aminobenzene 5'-phosphate synthase
MREQPVGGAWREVATYVHPGMFRTRAMKGPDGAMRPFEDVPSLAELTQNGARIVNTTEPQSVFDGTFFISGEIPRVTPFEEGFPGQHRKTEDGQGWET